MRTLIVLLLLGLALTACEGQRRNRNRNKPVDEVLKKAEAKEEASSEDESNEEEEEEEQLDEANTVEVATPYGYLKGLKVESEDEDDDMVHYRFLGIPYAEAPTGRRRFKDPVPIRPWQGIRNATKFGNSCPQSNIFGGKPQEFTGAEDCLFLNVFTPRLPRSRARTFVSPDAAQSHLLPVMVFIHGGGFVLGNGDVDPAPLLKKDVVVVTLNYRLGALGFLSLNSPLAAGNQGLKDQVEALKFVQLSIADFGGDPARVVLFGESAGAMSVHMHVVSPLGDGLYHGAIVQSGAALALETDLVRGNAEESSQRLVNDLGCGQSIDAYRVLQCLQNVNATKIYNATLTADKQNPAANTEEELNGRGPYRWVPSVDITSASPFLPEHPTETLAAGAQKQIPVIMGVTKDDGGLLPAFAFWDKLDALNANFTEYYGPQFLLAVKSGQADALDKMKAEAVKRFYLGSERNFTQETKQEMIDLFGDSLFNFPSYKSLQLHSRTAPQTPVFMYELAHKPSKTLMALFGKDTGAAGEDWGVAHGDDLLFLFDGVFGLEDAVTSQDDEDVQEQMVTMWTNFAKHGDPTPYQDGDLVIWEPFEESYENYLEIKPDSEVKSGYHPTRMFFWQRIIWDDLERRIETSSAAPVSAAAAAAPRLLDPLPAPAAVTSVTAGGQANAHQGQPRAYVSSQGLPASPTATANSSPQQQVLPFPFGSQRGNFFYQA